MVVAMSLSHLIAYIAILALFALACGAKGNYRYLLFGAPLPVFWLIGAVAPAQPGSLWARVRYTYLEPRRDEDSWH